MSKESKLSRADTKKLFHKLAVARSDILAARAACRFFVEHVKETNHTIYYPLFVSVVVCYARPFTDNNTLGRLPKKWGMYADPRLQAAHHQLLKARNEVVAHSDGNVKEIKVVPAGVEYPWQTLTSKHHGFMIMNYLLPPESFKTYLDTIYDLMDRLNPEVQRLFDELYVGQQMPADVFPLQFNDEL